MFLALDHDAAFIAQCALASLPINAATIFLSLTYVVLAQRENIVVSLCASVMMWLTVALLMKMIHRSLVSGILANAVAFAICLPLMNRFSDVKMPLITRRRYDIPVRAALVATLVATVVTLCSWVGPTISGIVAPFPVALTSLMLILHPRIGGPSTAAVIANGGWGLMGLGIGFGVIHAAALQLSSAAALGLALATCVGWISQIKSARSLLLR